MKTFLSRFFLCILLVGWAAMLTAQPEDGKVYRLISKMYPTLAATEDISTNGIVTREKGGKEAFEQMWRFDARGAGFKLTNVLTGNAINNYGGSNNQYWTDSNGAAHTFLLVSQPSDYWNVCHNTGMGGLHAAWTGKVVYWHDNAADATQWKLEEITGISEEQLALKQIIYKNYVDLTTHEAQYNEALKGFFTDESCTELLPAYASMSDNELCIAMSGLPEDFSRIALKVKNNTWEHREREFRIRDYIAYSDPDYWYKELLITRPGRINNPTGIYGNKGDIILVFVGNEIPEGATLGLEFIQDTNVEGSAVTLHRGLNVLTVAQDESLFYIQYIGTTSLSSERLITDYPALRIHIENGTVNGFWNMAEHTDEDWADILSHATASSIDVKGEKVMYHMHTSVMRKNCPTGIHDAIDWWENMLTWERGIMGLEGIVPEKCNNMSCAITLDDDHTYMAATWYRTQYHVNVAYKILNFSTVVTDPDYCFGPAHENGHMYQGAINIAGCTESSNGVLENLVVWKIGKYLTRGPVNATIYNEYAAGIPWINRSNDGMLRLQWQLYLYFHELGIDPTFWPRVFRSMRQTPLPIRWGDKKEVTASQDMLLFAKTCCDVAQMDLSVFFGVYGYLVPHERMETRESNTFLTTPQKDIDDFVAYACQYPKAPPLEFLDDRTSPIPRTDGGSGNRLTYDYGPGQCGDVGLYTDFLLTSVPAEGYIYSRTGNSITLKNGTGAVGFRLYDKDSGELVYLTNCLRFTLPANCQSIHFHIVAVQADGTEVRVPSTAEAGTEAEQLTALKNSLATAESTLKLSDDEGLTIGHIFSYALTDLQTLYDAALAARDGEDQSLHTYGQWAILLDEAVQAVRSNAEVRVPIWTENVYAFYLATYKNYSLYYLSNGPKGNTLDPETDDKKQWQLVPVVREDNDEKRIHPAHRIGLASSSSDRLFAIQNVSSGLYITSLVADKRAKLESDDIERAVLFDVQHTANGLVTFASPGTGLYLSYNSDKEAIGSTEASLWRVSTVIDHHAEALQARADAYMRVAFYMEGDLRVRAERLAILSNDFDTLKQRFLESYHAVQALCQHQAVGRLDLRLDELWEAMEALSPTYCDREIDDYVEHYEGPERSGYYIFLQNLRTGTYAYYNDQPGRYEGCLRMGALTDPDDKRFLFYLQRDNDGNYFLRNACSNHHAALWGSYIDVSGERTPIPFSIAYDEEAGGFILTSDEGSLTCQTTAGGYVQLRTKATQWKFRAAGRYIPDGVGRPTTGTTCDEDTPVYDLAGRRVAHPQRGIYIRDDGRKVIIP